MVMSTARIRPGLFVLPVIGAMSLVLLSTPGVAAPAPAPARELALECRGHFVQGGFITCRTDPGAAILVDGTIATKADGTGQFVVGFDRDAPAGARIVVTAGGRTLEKSLTIAPRSYNIQRIDGLPPALVTPQDPELLKRIAAENARKQKGYASRAVEVGFAENWAWPLAPGYRISGAWGGQRILNGEAKTPHYGVDFAIAKGTEIRAPAAGIVAFAETGLHFEGGLVLIDHGQGLISAYLHMSRVNVKPGDHLAKGDLIGLVGAEGRATGPHLCWRLKWRGRYLDPSLALADSDVQ